MVNTLRRKMFKMGGNVPKAHGVGITSNLKMKKGGRVEPQATFGVGNNALRKTGPDGKEREAHFAFLPFLVPGATTALRLAPRLLSRRGIASIGKFLSPKPAGTTMAGRATARGASGSRVLPGRPITETGPGGVVTRRSAQIATPGARTGVTAAGVARAAPRIAGTALAGGAGLGGISALFPRIEDPQSIGGQLFEGGRSLAEGAFNISSFLPGAIAQLGRSPEDFQGSAGAIRSALYGDTKAPVPGSEDESERTKEIKTQESEFEGLSEKAEALAKEISRENNLATLSQAALQFGQAATAGEDLATSLSAGTAPIFDELGRRRDLQENIAGQLATQIIADEATQSAMIAEAAKTGDPAAVNRMQKYFDAYNEGVTNILPIDAKGKMDTANMAPATVYMDLEGASGSRYVAVNSAESGGVPKAFDSIEDANAYAQS
jgi:hypothetical protein